VAPNPNLQKRIQSEGGGEATGKLRGLGESAEEIPGGTRATSEKLDVHKKKRGKKKRCLFGLESIG